MVASNGISTINNNYSGSNGSTMYVKRKIDKPQEESKVNVPSCKIKFHKVKKQNKFKVIGKLPEYYISDISVPKTDVNNFEKMTIKYRFVSLKKFEDIEEHYTNGCYVIDYMFSPIRGKGEGTKAIRSLVEKAISDKDTEGRILVDVKVIDGETSAAGFFYKLGFRFTDELKNEIMQNWLTNQKTQFSPKIVGMMYLPQDKMKKLMMYKILL